MLEIFPGVKITVVFFTAFLIAMGVTFVVRRYAIAHKIGEAPDRRKVHKTFMPHMGGLGIFSGFLSGVILAFLLFPQLRQALIQDYVGLIIAALLIVALGAWDDLKGANAAEKFFGQFLISTLLIAFGCRITSIQLPFIEALPLGILSIPVTYLWLVGVSNAINLLDGLDGLAAGFSVISSAVMLVLSIQHQQWALAVLTLSLMAGALGFLKFNYHPAKIFMGDTGSLFLGLMLAVLSLKVAQPTLPGRVNLLLPLLILAIPIGDTSVAFFRRLNKGKHPFKPDKDHLHHRLIYLGLSHRQAVHIIYLVSALYATTAYLTATQTPFVSGLLLSIVLILSVFGLKRVGYLEAKRLGKRHGIKAFQTEKPQVAPLSMRRLIHKLLFLLSDLAMINVSLYAAWWVKYASGWFRVAVPVTFAEFWFSPLPLILSVFWVGLFLANNLYSIRWDVSRFDHLRTTGKVILFGNLLLFIVTMDPGTMLSEGRLILLVYMMNLLVFISLGRLLLIQIEKYFAILEYAPHPTLLIGATEKARKLLKDIHSNPHLLYDVKGYVSRECTEKKIYGLDCLGSYEDLPDLIRTHGVEEIIIAIKERSRDDILNLVARVESSAVVFKILPQLYDVISGHKTEQVSGHPLMKLFPDPMRLWQWVGKRLLDIVISAVLLILLSPFFLLAYAAQLLAGISPVFRTDNVVGKNGTRFGMLNLETKKGNTRPPLGQLIYSSRLYKFPALINVLLGQMSLVGPRPEDEATVEKFREKIKFYNRRFQIRPGFTGWAQVRYRYEEALKFKREQLKQELYYIENMSLTLDLQILLRSVVIFFTGLKETK